jgi:hypothetical protein
MEHLGAKGALCSSESQGRAGASAHASGAESAGPSSHRLQARKPGELFKRKLALTQTDVCLDKAITGLVELSV